MCARAVRTLYIQQEQKQALVPCRCRRLVARVVDPSGGSTQRTCCIYRRCIYSMLQKNKLWAQHPGVSHTKHSQCARVSRVKSEERQTSHVQINRFQVNRRNKSSDQNPVEPLGVSYKVKVYVSAKSAKGSFPSGSTAYVRCAALPPGRTDQTKGESTYDTGGRPLTVALWLKAVGHAEERMATLQAHSAASTKGELLCHVRLERGRHRHR